MKDTLLEFSPSYVSGLFDRMSATYGKVNLVSSFGFAHFWRATCLESLAVDPGHKCADLMCGMAEMTALLKRVDGVSVEAFDFSAGMCEGAKKAVVRNGWNDVTISQGDVLLLPSEARYDRVAVTFGLKTLAPDQLNRFAQVLFGILAKEGRASLVEIYVPRSRLLRLPYLFYLRWIIPAVGRLFLGNPDCYRSLAVYTENFARTENFGAMLESVGFAVSTRPLFFGCAKLYLAEKRA